VTTEQNNKVYEGIWAKSEKLQLKPKGAHGNVESRRPKARALSAPKESNVPQNRLLQLN
jgi:hypothetical protein